MKLSLLIIVNCFFFNNLLAQGKIGIICNDFQINNQDKEIGREFRRTFESVIGGLEYPPEIIERENFPELLILIQEEENIQKDFGNKYLTDEAKAAKVDYVVYGNFYKPFENDEYEFQMKFVKISNKDILVKKVFPIIRFKGEELLGTKTFEVKLKVMLNQFAFSEEFGIIDVNQFGKIIRKFDLKDSIIIENTKSLIEKERRIKELEKSESLRKKELEKKNELRSKPPEIDVFLRIVGDSLMFVVKPLNEVPIIGTYDVLSKSKKSLVPKFWLEPIKYYPNNRYDGLQSFYGTIDSFNANINVASDEIILEANFESIFYKETLDDALIKKKTKRYNISITDKTIEEILE